jgi:hypothetical protein
LDDRRPLPRHPRNGRPGQIAVRAPTTITITTSTGLRQATSECAGGTSNGADELEVCFEGRRLGDGRSRRRLGSVKRVGAVAVAIAVGVLAGCGGSGSDGPVPRAVLLADLNLGRDSKIKLTADRTVAFLGGDLAATSTCSFGARVQYPNALHCQLLPAVPSEQSAIHGFFG